MEKNALFLISLGMVLFVLSANARTGEYNVLNIVTSLSLMGAGLALFFRSRKKKKSK